MNGTLGKGTTINQEKKDSGKGIGNSMQKSKDCVGGCRRDQVKDDMERLKLVTIQHFMEHSVCLRVSSLEVSMLSRTD